MKRLNYILYLLVAAAAAFMASRGNGDDDTTPHDTSRHITEHADYHNANANQEGASFVATETKKSSSVFTSLTEIPKLQEGDVFIVHQATDIKGSPVNYSVAYVPSLHHSRWVAFRFDKKMKTRNVTRKDNAIRPKYPQDPLFDATTRSDESFHGYDHGHLCASADRLCSRQANDQTFYMSNMSPQLPSFNQDYWTRYEDFVQDLGRNCGIARGSDAYFADTLFVVKGGTIIDTRETTKVEKYRMPVPDHYFMALLSVKEGKYEAIGFWMEHRHYDRSVVKKGKAEIAAHVVSIDRLESLTGIDFFCNLPGDVEQTVEASYTLEAWGL